VAIPGGGGEESMKGTQRGRGLDEKEAGDCKGGMTWDEKDRVD